jgi:hypothetical protein
MPRPKSKEELLNLSSENYHKLMDHINQLDKEFLSRDFPEGMLNRNIADVLMHLHHWHLMMLSWYEQGMKGQKPAMPAEGYTWKTLPDLNLWIWEKYKSYPLKEAVIKLDESHILLQQLINKHSNEELFEKKRYNWTGSTSLAAYLISSTSSHYDWALKLIKKAQKAY